jgi:hypothetical protein
LDAEIDLLLAQSRVPPHVGSWHLEQWLYVPMIILDAGIGNVDGVPGAELVLLGQRSIEIYTLRGGKPTLLISHRLIRLPDAKHIARDPSGNLLVVDFNLDGQHELFYKLFNFGFGEILSWQGSDLRSLRQLDQVPLCVLRKEERAHVIFGSQEPGTNHYLPMIEDTDINSSKGQKIELTDKYTTFRCWQSKEAQTQWFAWIDLQHRLVRFDPGKNSSVILEKAGTGMGIVDFDMDQTPELVCSDPVWPGEQDSLRVVTEGEIAWQSKTIIGSIMAIAGGDLIGNGKNQAVIVAWDPSEFASRIYLLQK